MYWLEVRPVASSTQCASCSAPSEQYLLYPQRHVTFPGANLQGLAGKHQPGGERLKRSIIMFTRIIPTLPGFMRLGRQDRLGQYVPQLGVVGAGVKLGVVEVYIVYIML